MSLDQLRDQHHQNWSEVPPWPITASSIDAAEQATQHASELSKLQRNLEQTASSLEDVKSKLAETSKEKEEAVSKISELQVQCTKLQTEICEYERKVKKDAGGGDDQEVSDSNNNPDGQPQEEGAALKTRDENNKNTSPFQPSAIALLRSQNEQLLKQVESLVAKTSSAKNGEQQLGEDSSTSNDEQSTVVNRFIQLANSSSGQNGNENNQNNEDDEENTKTELQQTIRRLRSQLAAAEERAFIAERMSTRTEEEAREQEFQHRRSQEQQKTSSSLSSDDQNEQQQQHSSSARRRQRNEKNSSTHPTGSNPSNTAAVSAGAFPSGPTNDSDLDSDDGNNTFHSAVSPTSLHGGEHHHHHQHGGGGGKQITVPKNSTELMRFWTFGQRQINKLKQALAEANNKVDQSTMKIQAFEDLKSSRSQVIQNIQTIAEELETSRDECTRLRIEVEAKSLENNDLVSHLTNALRAADISKEEVQKCAWDLREAAEKRATIEAMTAPEMSVAKDAMKKNQALQHELTLMAKRRDDLKAEVESKQRMLESMAAHSWLFKQTSSSMNNNNSNNQDGAADNNDDDIFNTSNSLFGVSKAVITVFASATTKLQDQIAENEQKLFEKDQMIFALEKRLASFSSLSSNNTSADQQQQQQQAEDSIPPLAASFENDGDVSSNFVSLKQDAAISILKQRLQKAQSKINQQEIFIETAISTIGDVSSLVQNLMKLLESILSSHSLFAPNKKASLTDGEDAATSAMNNNTDGNSNNNTDSDSSSSLTPEERAVITQVLAILEEHKSLVTERLSLIEMFKQLGENSNEASSCGTLEQRAVELADAKTQVSDLVKRLEEVQKENAEKTSWYSVVERGIDELKKQGEVSDRQNISAWSLFSETAMQKIDVSVRDQIKNAVAKPPSAVVVTSNNEVVENAKAVLQKSETVVNSAPTS